MADQQAELPAAPTGPEATVQFVEFESWLQARYPLEPDAGYLAWLAASCGVTDCQETGIHRLSPKATNDVGWRHVSLATVLKKALNYMEAKQWSGNMAPIQVFPLAGGQLFGYITGHQRMVALHMVCVCGFTCSQRPSQHGSRLWPSKFTSAWLLQALRQQQYTRLQGGSARSFMRPSGATSQFA